MPLPAPTPGGESAVGRDLDGLAATAALAADLARLARPGDVIGLSGDLGTGKTSFARAFINARARASGTEVGEVPSPTFTLVQTYDLPGVTIWHFDLYRLERPEDAYELGIEDAFAGGLSLIEWPERAAALLPADRLELEFSFSESPDRRHVRLVGRGDWAARLAGLAGAKRDAAQRDGAQRDGAQRDGAQRDGAKRDGAKRDGA